MSYIPGKAVWFELATPDQDAARRFYGEVFGWKSESVPMGPGEYTMFKAGGADGQFHSGIVEPQGPAPHWVAYVSVDDVDAVAERARKSGGKVIMGPETIPTVGRMAGIVDPEGGALMAFKAEETDGPDTAAYGGFFWIELMSDDPGKAADWYKNAFGYDKVESMEMSTGPYHVLSRDGRGRAGVMGKPEGPIPTYWLAYVAVEDVDAVIARVEKNGGQSVMDPIDVEEVGRIGAIVDPQGAHLGIIAPAQPIGEPM